MTKSNRKIYNKLRVALTEVCKISLENVIGFKRLAHFINNGNFPDSYLMSCVFDNRVELLQLPSLYQDELLCRLFIEKLSVVDIKAINIMEHVHFVVEEDLSGDNVINWRE